MVRSSRPHHHLPKNPRNTCSFPIAHATGRTNGRTFVRLIFLFFVFLCVSQSSFSHPHDQASWLCKTPTCLEISKFGQAKIICDSGAEFVLTHEANDILVKYAGASRIRKLSVHQDNHLRNEAIGLSPPMGTISIKTTHDGSRLSWVKTLHSVITEPPVQFLSGTCKRLPEN